MDIVLCDIVEVSLLNINGSFLMSRVLETLHVRIIFNGPDFHVTFFEGLF